MKDPAAVCVQKGLWRQRRRLQATRVEFLSTRTITERKQLRPVERRVLRLVDSGVDVAEIGRRFRRSTGHIERLISLAQLPGRAPLPRASGLRPLERCILGWRAKGATHDEIAPRLIRSPGFIARVEELALYKLAER